MQPFSKLSLWVSIKNRIMKDFCAAAGAGTAACYSLRMEGQMPDLAHLLVLAAIVVVATLSALLLWPWNITMPDVFGLKTISFWQAVKLPLIAGILFGPPSAIRLTDNLSPPASHGSET
jgi:hypothetical protein